MGKKIEQAPMLERSLSRNDRLIKPLSTTRLINDVFRWVTILFAFSVISIVASIAIQLFLTALPAIQQFGLQFLITTQWNPVKNIYGILPQIYGTLVSSLIALLFAVPLGVGIAILLTEDIFLKKILPLISFPVELLAAIPSVVYGLWGIAVLVPIMQPWFLWLHNTLGWIPLFNTAPSNKAILSTSVVLAIMILPIVTAISRDTLTALPIELRQAAVALGATRWETILRVLVPAGLSGIVGAAVLALGRALGETSGDHQDTEPADVQSIVCASYPIAKASPQVKTCSSL